MEKLEYLGPYIYYISQKRHIQPSAICSFAGISFAELNTIQNGKYEPHPNTMKRICDFLNIDFIELFRKQEKYQALLVETFHSLTFDIINEQWALIEKVEKIDFEKSILFPEYLLLKAVYLCMNQPSNEEIHSLFEKISLFVNVFSNDYKGLYYVYRGIYYRNHDNLDKAEKYLQLADKVSPFSFREVLYQHYGILRYMQDQFLETLDYYEKAYALYEKRWNINRLLYTKGAVGYCYIGMRRYDLADEQIHNTLRLAKQYKSELVIRKCYDNLAFTHFLMRDYEQCISLAMKAINAGSTYPYIYFYLAYSYARSGNTGEAALWAGKREFMDVNSVPFDCLMYVKHMIDRYDDTSFMLALYERLRLSDIKEARVFLLEDIAEIHHQNEDYVNENKILYKIIDIIR